MIVGSITTNALSLTLQFPLLVKQPAFLLQPFFVQVMTACSRWHAANMTEQFKQLMLKDISQSEITRDELPVQAQPDDTLWNIPS